MAEIVRLGIAHQQIAAAKFGADRVHRSGKPGIVGIEKSELQQEQEAAVDMAPAPSVDETVALGAIGILVDHRANAVSVLVPIGGPAPQPKLFGDTRPTGRHPPST